MTDPTTLTQRFMGNVRRLRDELGLSAADLANATGISRAVIANAESGRKDTVTLDEAYAYARALGTSIDYLAELVGPRCIHCHDTPPLGFRCLACNAKGIPQ
jgi:transcriptional regulator with XRE-family HTH domain